MPEISFGWRTCTANPPRPGTTSPDRVALRIKFFDGRNPRKNALLKAGTKSDGIDARNLAGLLRVGLLSAVCHGQTGLRKLKELCRSYLTISKDLTRNMNPPSRCTEAWSIPCAGTSAYAPCHRAEWLSKITEAGLRRRPSCSIRNWMGCATRFIGGEPQAWRDEPPLPDFAYRSDSGCSVARADPDAASVSHQETTIGVQRFDSEEAQQWGIPLLMAPMPLLPVSCKLRRSWSLVLSRDQGHTPAG